MELVSFLQQKITEVSQEIEELIERRMKLQTALHNAILLQKNNLKNPDDLV